MLLLNPRRDLTLPVPDLRRYIRKSAIGWSRIRIVCTGSDDLYRKTSKHMLCLSGYHIVASTEVEGVNLSSRHGILHLKVFSRLRWGGHSTMQLITIQQCLGHYQRLFENTEPNFPSRSEVTPIFRDSSPGVHVVQSVRPDFSIRSTSYFLW
jgi:hypothetical protein